MLSVRGGNEATGGRLLRLLFLRGHLLPAKADGVAAALSATRDGRTALDNASTGSGDLVEDDERHLLYNAPTGW